MYVNTNVSIAELTLELVFMAVRKILLTPRAESDHTTSLAGVQRDKNAFDIITTL